VPAATPAHVLPECWREAAKKRFYPGNSGCPQHPPCSLVSLHWNWVQALVVLGSVFPWSKLKAFKNVCGFRWLCLWSGDAAFLKDALSQHHLSHSSPSWEKVIFAPNW